MKLIIFYGHLSNSLSYQIRQILNLTPTTPILLYKNNFKSDSIIKKDYSVVLNIDMKLDTNENEHEIIIEIVGHDENKKNISREKYLYYKKNNLDVRHENL